jgi:hypothetical protein
MIMIAVTVDVRREMLGNEGADITNGYGYCIVCFLTRLTARP